MQHDFPHSSRWIRSSTRAYARMCGIALAMVPAALIAYLYYFQDPSLRFEDHFFHEIAIAAAIFVSGFITYVTWRCYSFSGEVFLRWLTLGFLAFTLIYAPHGIFTRFAHENLFLFMLYGPASRLVMAACFLTAMLHYQSEPELLATRKGGKFWLSAIIIFVAIDFAVAALALSPYGSALWVRQSMEMAACVIGLVTMAIMLWQRITSPLMKIFILSLAFFASSSISFIISAPWNHQWWLAHALFASGFFYLGYGVVQAFLTTRSFSAVYSQEEMMQELTESRARTVAALEQLKHVNQDLVELASTDPLTGASNRRIFYEKVDLEIARVDRSDTSFSVLAIDLDFFKTVNDKYGHAVGDAVLKSFVSTVTYLIRPADTLGRVGGEEFALLLPATGAGGALLLAERIRLAIEASPLSEHEIPVTISVGVAQYGVDGDKADSLMETADKRMYRAKKQGRNQVVSE